MVAMRPHTDPLGTRASYNLFVIVKRIFERPTISSSLDFEIFIFQYSHRKQTIERYEDFRENACPTLSKEIATTETGS